MGEATLTIEEALEKWKELCANAPCCDKCIMKGAMGDPCGLYEWLNKLDE